MKYQDNINSLSDLMPDYMGFIFYPPSKRFIGLDFQKSDLDRIPAEINKTAVFVNAQLHEVIEFSNLYGMKTIQLHGNESPEFCLDLKNKGFTVFKAFGIDEHFDFSVLTPYTESVDYFLFDTKSSGHGGSGIKFNWELLQNYKLNKPFILSGGLGLENLEEVKQLKHSHFYGVDLNSRFETEPGLKDLSKLKKAFDLLRD